MLKSNKSNPLTFLPWGPRFRDLWQWSLDRQRHLGIHFIKLPEKGVKLLELLRCKLTRGPKWRCFWKHLASLHWKIKKWPKIGGVFWKLFWKINKNDQKEHSPTGWLTVSGSPLILKSQHLIEAFFGRAKTFLSIKPLTEWYTPLKKCYQAWKLGRLDSVMRLRLIISCSSAWQPTWKRLQHCPQTAGFVLQLVPRVSVSTEWRELAEGRCGLEDQR